MFDVMGLPCASGTDSFITCALQEYHIRQMDGHTLDAEAKQKLKKCLEAAIERRSCEV